MEASTTVKWQGAEELRQHLRPINELAEFAGNPHRGNVARIADSLRRFGQVRAVLIDASDGKTLVAGHHVWKAAKSLGWSHIAAIPAEFETRDDARDYLIADNRLARIGNDDNAAQISFLEDTLIRRGTLEGTGFTPEELDDIGHFAQHRQEVVAAEDLRPHEHNYKEHPDDQIEHLVASLERNGFYRNVVIANDGTILAGHGLVKAAEKIGLKRIPVHRLDCGPDDPEALKVLAGDNELGNLAERDDRKLTEALQMVMDTGDVGGLLGTGFNAQTLASLVMVTRPASEIQDHDHAMEWVGLPGFEKADHRIKLVLSFETEEERQQLVDQLGVFVTQMRVSAGSATARTWSAWWPPRQREDLNSVRFEPGRPVDDDPDDIFDSEVIDVETGE